MDINTGDIFVKQTKILNSKRFRKTISCFPVYRVHRVTQHNTRNTDDDVC